VERLLTGNRPSAFWRVLPEPGEEAWAQAFASARATVSWPFPLPDTIDELLAATLGEAQFGHDRYRLGPARRTYYAVLRPALPAVARPLLRRLWRARASARPVLGWPIEDRYVRFQLAALAAALAAAGRRSAEIAWLWPRRAGFAACLTHDVEGRSGYDFVTRLAGIEEAVGLRSMFNFVPGDYRVDRGLVDDLRARGFEVGVHGFRHDGRLFSSRRRFEEHAAAINGVLGAWAVEGFRSPLTHRHPEWMQELEIGHDLSFFDTDPFEPMPGGTMSIWPFFLGRFVELPYTLPQDHTLLELGVSPGAVWREKTAFVRAHHGMALVNVHPDYVRAPSALAAYRDFLEWLAGLDSCWHALPHEVAAWWRSRSEPHAVAEPGDVVRVDVDGTRPVFDLRPRASLSSDPTAATAPARAPAPRPPSRRDRHPV
jgi:hypothetical protein